jgi:hypothetical protein
MSIDVKSNLVQGQKKQGFVAPPYRQLERDPWLETMAPMVNSWEGFLGG